MVRRTFWKLVGAKSWKLLLERFLDFLLSFYIEWECKISFTSFSRSKTLYILLIVSFILFSLFSYLATSTTTSWSWAWSSVFHIREFSRSDISIGGTLIIMYISHLSHNGSSHLSTYGRNHRFWIILHILIKFRISSIHNHVYYSISVLVLLTSNPCNYLRRLPMQVLMLVVYHKSILI